MLSCLFIALPFLFLLIFNHFKRASQFTWLNGIVISGILILLGFAQAESSYLSKQPLNLNSKKVISWSGKVVSIQKRDASINSFVVEVWPRNRNNEQFENQFNLLVYNSIEELCIRIGDYIATSSRIREISPPKNPAQFNYKEFLSNRGVYLQSRLSDQYVIRNGFSFSSYFNKWREDIVSIYEEWKIHGSELSVLTAITLGDKSKLNDQIKSAFAGSGAMHVLAVSGLHVGIIYLLITLFTNRLIKIRSSLLRWLGVFIELSVIWMFAFLCGFSPSVQRATIMLSFIILSKGLNRNTHIINSIAASAFFILLINPFAIFELGFQLSYAAVLGIVLIYAPIRKLFRSRYLFVNKVFDLAIVSIAAQIATLPFVLHYFHQFPNYFLLSNFLIIPIAFILVGLSYLSLLIHLIIGSDLFLGQLINIILKFLNSITELINSFPYAISADIWLHPISIFALSLTITALVLYLNTRKAVYFISSLMLVLAMFLTQTIIDYNHLYRKKVIAYSLESGILSFILGSNAQVLAFDSISDYERMIVKNHLNQIGVRDINWKESVNRNYVYPFENNCFLINPTEKAIQQLAFTPDWVLIDESFGLNSLDTSLKYAILDVSIRKHSKQYESIKSNNNYYNLIVEGATEIGFKE